MVLLTQYLNLTPKKEVATTDKPVVITQAPGTVIHGTGMVYDKKQQTMKLLSKVKVHYERPPQARIPGQPKAKSKKVTAPSNKTSKIESGSKKASPTKNLRKTVSKKTPQATSSTQKITRIRRQYEHAQTQP
jgi:lipopolysaccharide export system protein LptC